MNHPVCPVPASPAEAARLLSEPLETLLDSAAVLRERRHGKRISLCAIINARSGDCGMDCRFCSQSSHNHTPIAHFPFLRPPSCVDASCGWRPGPCAVSAS